MKERRKKKKQNKNNPFKKWHLHALKNGTLARTLLGTRIQGKKLARSQAKQAIQPRV
jgi:hypothetical protein